MQCTPLCAPRERPTSETSGRELSGAEATSWRDNSFLLSIHNNSIVVRFGRWFDGLMDGMVVRFDD